MNVGDENQKSGVKLNDFDSFYKKITEDFDLNIIGLMCIPPFVDDTKKYFEKMNELKSKTNLKTTALQKTNSRSRNMAQLCVQHTNIKSIVNMDWNTS